MLNDRQPRDIPQILLSVLFLSLIIISCLWVCNPLFCPSPWAGTVVIATWPVLLRLQRLLFSKRALVLVADRAVVLLFVIPIALLVNSPDNSIPLIKLISTGNVTLPDFASLNSVPLIGDKLYATWHGLLDMGAAIMAKIRPYRAPPPPARRRSGGAYRQTAGLLRADAVVQRLLYWQGEKVAYGFRYFATRLAAKRGDAAVLLAGQAIRAVAPGVVVTALVQAVLGGIGSAISGVPYAALLTVVMIFTCPVQLGPVAVPVPRLSGSTGPEIPPGHGAAGMELRGGDHG
ncbi:hypothetical protein DMH17_09650 [Raoultella planticola]|nr:hypothetical protein [Raoultella planticola]